MIAAIVSTFFADPATKSERIALTAQVKAEDAATAEAAARLYAEEQRVEAETAPPKKRSLALTQNRNASKFN